MAQEKEATKKTFGDYFGNKSAEADSLQQDAVRRLQEGGLIGKQGRALLTLLDSLSSAPGPMFGENQTSEQDSLQQDALEKLKGSGLWGKRGNPIDALKRIFGEKRKKDKEEIYKDKMAGLRKRGNLIKSRDPIIKKAYANRLRNLFAMMEQENEYDFLDGNDFLLSEDDLSMIANSTQFSHKKDLGYKDKTEESFIYDGLGARVARRNALSDEDILKKILQIPFMRQGKVD